MTTTPTTRASLLLKLRDPHDHEAWVEIAAAQEKPDVAKTQTTIQ